LSCLQDVHEIKFGADWQDALNIAVSNCEVFVPLVTPRYGETLWTNREVCLNVIHTLTLTLLQALFTLTMGYLNSAVNLISLHLHQLPINIG